MVRKIGVITIVVILAYLIAEISFRTGILDSLENSYYDLWHQMAGKRTQPTHTTIVIIDDETIRATKTNRWPFGVRILRGRLKSYARPVSP